ncbi:MAG: hypothetical protein LBR17_06500 [Bacteroidales bacterium]|jgi:hypothetical protein|nr:hypothetical protein [Bacteroidales bacterium]
MRIVWMQSAITIIKVTILNGFVPLNRQYDKFTQQEFDLLKFRYNSESIEYLLCDFYSGNTDSILSKIQDKKYDSTTISKEYYSIINEIMKPSDCHASFIVGTWIPTGSMTKLGVHPAFGFQIGAKSKKWSYDVAFIFSGSVSSNLTYPYRRSSHSSWEVSDHFVNLYLAFETGRDIVKEKHHELQVIGGAGFDGFNGIRTNEDEKSAMGITYDLNLGLAYRYYFTRSFYMGLRGKLHIVDYKLSGNLNMTSPYFSLQMSIGGFEMSVKNRYLKGLQYKNDR